MPTELGLRYSLKANPLPAVASHLVKLVDGFDVSSIRETEIALATGIQSTNVSFSGPGKTAEEIKDNFHKDRLIKETEDLYRDCLNRRLKSK